MSCTTCSPTAPPAHVPQPQPAPPAPCAGAEICEEVQDAACVAYTGEPLTNLRVNPNDRLSLILAQLNKLFGQGAGSVYLESTPQLLITGDGSADAPFFIRPVIDKTVAHNLLVAGKKGLSVKFEVPETQRLLTLIADTPALKKAFCSICVGSAVPDPDCEKLILQLLGEATRDPRKSTSGLQVLRWNAPLVVDTLPLLLQYRTTTGPGEWFNQSSLPKTTTSWTADDLLVNVRYQFRLLLRCSATLTSESAYVESCLAGPIGPITLVGQSTSMLAQFAHLGADVDRYSLVVGGGDLTQPVTLEITELSPTITQTLPSLTLGVEYALTVITYVQTYSAVSSQQAFVYAYANATIPAPAQGCDPPLNVSSSYDAVLNQVTLHFPELSNAQPASGWHISYRNDAYLVLPEEIGDVRYPSYQLNTNSRNPVLSEGITYGASYLARITAACATGTSEVLLQSFSAGTNCAAIPQASIQAQVVRVTGLPNYPGKIQVSFAIPAGTQRSTHYRLSYRPQNATSAYLTKEVTSLETQPYELLDQVDPALAYECLLETICQITAVQPGTAFLAHPPATVSQVFYEALNARDLTLDSRETCGSLVYTQRMNRVTVNLLDAAGLPTVLSTPIEFSYTLQLGLGGSEQRLVRIAAGQSTGSDLFLSLGYQVSTGLQAPSTSLLAGDEGGGGTEEPSCQQVINTYGGIVSISIPGVMPR